MLLLVLGFVQSVGVDQQLAASDIVDGLALERIILPEAKGPSTLILSM